MSLFIIGAGNCLDESKYERVSKEACVRATQILKAGGSAMDACEAAIVRLENSGHTNAGYGSNLTWDRTVECEASIMDGKSLQFGACTNLTDIVNPISLARIICERQSNLLKMNRIPPMVLSGAGASMYARQMQVPMVANNESLMSRKAIRIFEHCKREVSLYERTNAVELTALDTVGAVCVDSIGNCVAGCSSGGLILKVSGRVGQAATYGAGCWAINGRERCAATCTTGNGEYLMRTLLAREIVSDLLVSDCSITSLHNTFKRKFLGSPFLGDMREVYGGALSLVYDATSGDGEILWSHTTKSFCLAHMSTAQKTPKVSKT